MIEGLESMHNLLLSLAEIFCAAMMSSPFFYPHKLSGDEIGWLSTMVPMWALKNIMVSCVP